jgi:hypothetical protein
VTDFFSDPSGRGLLLPPLEAERQRLSRSKIGIVVYFACAYCERVEVVHDREEGHFHHPKEYCKCGGRRWYPIGTRRLEPVDLTLIDDHPH